MKCRWNRTMLNLCDIVVAIWKMATARDFSMSGNNSGHHYLPTYQIWWYRTMLNFCDHFQNGDRYIGNLFGASLSTHIWNVVEIGQCWICAILWWSFWKWRPLEIFQCQESIRDIIIYPHIKFWWYRTMLNFAAIFKMVTASNFSI